MSDSFNFPGEISPLENVSQNKVLSLPIGLNGGTCFRNISLGGSVLFSGVEIFTIPHRKFSNSGENRFERDKASINIVAIKNPDARDDVEFALAEDSMCDIHCNVGVTTGCR